MLTCPKILCTHCGACEAICPQGMIKLDKNSFFPDIQNKKKCINCGACDRVCPGTGVDFDAIVKAYDIDSGGAFSPWIGHYHKIHLAYSSDDDIRKRSSAGGVVTALIRYAFQKGLIDGAVMVGMEHDDPMRAGCFIARNIEEAERYSGSKYQVVPLARAMKDIKGLNRLAVVGLGCHVEAVRKYGMIDNAARGKIRFTIGLFCAMGNNSMEGTRFLADKMGIRNVKKLFYRRGDYPGGFYASDGKKEGYLRKDEYKWFSLLFTEPRCLQCIDLTNEAADISVGDSYSLARGDKLGRSVAITRSKTGEDLFNAALSDKAVIAEPLEPAGLVKSQRYQFVLSKVSIPRMNGMLKSKGSLAPENISKAVVMRNLNPKEYFEAFATFFIFKCRRFAIVVFKLLPLSAFVLASKISRRD